MKHALHRSFAAPGAFIMLAALSLAACDSAPSPQVHRVTIDATSYSPETLDVAVGDTVVWTNQDFLVHTVTTNDRVLDSQDIAAGESWRYEISTPVDLEYLCVYHPTMRGSLRTR